MEEGNLTLIIIALIGVFQVGLGIYFGRRNNEATATKDEATALSSAGSYYANLVDRLEARLAAADKREEKIMGRLAALEAKCEKYEALIDKYESIIEELG